MGFTTFIIMRTTDSNPDGQFDTLKTITPGGQAAYNFIIINYVYCCFQVLFHMFAYFLARNGKAAGLINFRNSLMLLLNIGIAIWACEIYWGDSYIGGWTAAQDKKYSDLHLMVFIFLMSRLVTVIIFVVIITIFCCCICALKGGYGIG